MRTVVKSLFAVLLTCGTVMAANAQKPSGKYQVSTQLKEVAGTYQERKLYREFLAEYMKNCPYISNFGIQEAIGSADNHEVVWKYEVNSWNDITSFYSWIDDQLKSGDGGGFKKAMAPYAPQYAIGGQIDMQKRPRPVLAKK